MTRIVRNNAGGHSSRKLSDSTETKAKEKQVKNQAKLDAEIKKQAKADGAGTSAAADESLPSSPTSSKYYTDSASFGSTTSSVSSTTVSKRITKWLGGYESASQPSTPGSSRRSTGLDEIQSSRADSLSSQPSTRSEHVLAPIVAPKSESKPLSKALKAATYIGAAGVGAAGGLFAAPYLLGAGAGDSNPTEDMGNVVP
ncbi:MAG TPA: hypothetical protein VK465_14545 [Fibrobacteria bacterium]|nr:hypothetical protein [Fibrobacteria bacterium]